MTDVPLRGDDPNPWTTTSSKVVYDNPWITVRHDEVLDPSGKPGVYGVVSPKNLALGVLPLFTDGTTMLVGQFRYALGFHSWELPEGGGAKDMEPRESIARELREETGLVAEHWLEVCRMHLSNSVTDELCISWVAWGLTESAAELESTEGDLTVRRVHFRELVEMVWNGEITDSITVAVTAKVEAMRLRKELPEQLLTILA